VKLIIQLPGAGFPFDISGRVTRVAEWNNRLNTAPGMAIEFLDLDRSKRERIDSFIERLRKDLEAA